MFALDETGLRLESENFYGWGPIGEPIEVESNGSHKGINVIGATEILREFRFYYSTYESKRGAEKGLKSVHVRKFIDKLMRLKEGQEVWIILDNSGAHKKVARECALEYGGRLHLLFLPPYSPELNPQENIWAGLKSYCRARKAYSSIKDLKDRVHRFAIYAYNTPSMVKRRVDPSRFFAAA